MALIATSGPIPKNAVALSPTEASAYQWKQIMEWPDFMDKWPFKYGIGFMGILAAASGGIINRQYRIKLKLRQFGYGSTLIPLTLAPAMFSTVLHTQFALRHGTYSIPYWQDWRGHLNLWLELTRPMGKKLLILGIVNVLVAGFVTHAEGTCFYKIQLKLLEDQKDLPIEETSTSKK